MKNILVTLAVFINFGILAQNNVGIGTLTPNPQAVLDIQSNDKGVLISRLTTVSRTTLGTSLTGAEDGMLVYDKDLTTFFYWDGPNLQWVQVGSGTGDNWGVDVVNTLGTNIAGDGTPASPLVVTEVDGDITNEIQDLSLDPTTNILTITNNVAPTAINLSPFIDHDWYEVGGTIPADAITDDIYTQGNVGIGIINPTANLHVASPNIFAAKIQSTTKVYTDPTLQSVLAFTDMNDEIYGYIGDGSSLDQITIASYFDYDISFSTFSSNTSASRTGTFFMEGTNGFIGIQNQAPTAVLDVNGDLRVRTFVAGSSNDEVLVVDATGLVKKVPASSPVGEVITFAGAASPIGFLLCDGSAVDRTTYADLFAVIGTIYGTGNGTTTFNLPDLRGEFIRGLDAGRGADAGRVNGSFQTGTKITNDNGAAPAVHTLGNINLNSVDPTDINMEIYHIAATTVGTYGSDYIGMVRPRNVAMNYCIKY